VGTNFGAAIRAQADQFNPCSDQDSPTILVIAAVAIQDEALRPSVVTAAAEFSPSLGKLSGSIGKALKGRQKRQFVLPITSCSGCIGYIQKMEDDISESRGCHEHAKFAP
jgi:hypothetical protein